MEKDREYFRKVNIDKAENKTKVAFIIIIISLLTYVIPLMNGVYDFGIIFEVITLIFLIIARIFMKKYDETRCKKIYNMFNDTNRMVINI